MEKRYWKKTEGKVSNLKPDELLIRDERYLNSEGDIDWEKWAPNGGRISESVKEGQTLEVGKIIDRYGSTFGKYVSPEGTPYEQRALPYLENPNAYHKYKVIRPIENVTISEIAPAFEQIGRGIQYELPFPVKDLLGDYLEEIK